MDAWGGIIGAMKSSGKSKFALNAHVYSSHIAFTDNSLQPKFSNNTSNPSSTFSTLSVAIPAVANRL